MNDTPALASASRPANVPGHHRGLPVVRSLVATWRWRIRFRRELAEKSTNNPHLIDDIGLTQREVEAEIAKPFWQG